MTRHAPTDDPRASWPSFDGWVEVGMNESVFRVTMPTGDEAYVRPDDGSLPQLRRLARGGLIPVPEVVDTKGEWVVLAALPGLPLHEEAWLQRPSLAGKVAAEALARLEQAGESLGDMCLPNSAALDEVVRLRAVWEDLTSQPDPFD